MSLYNLQTYSQTDSTLSLNLNAAEELDAVRGQWQN